MENRISNKTQARVALVTGASAGIGQAIARRLLEDGWTVYAGARRVEPMAGLRDAGARIVSLDVTDEASMKANVEAILKAEGRVDALVNNAGYGSYGALEDVPLDEARRQFEVNVFGLVRLTQLVLPTMRAQRSGTIVNVSSMGGRIWMPIGGWYHATKHAVEVLSDALRVEVQPFGVKVVVVQPGAIQSEWSAIAAKNLRATRGGSVYGAQIEPMAAVLENYDSAAPAEVIADAVSRALSTPNPRRRYAAPLDAKVLILVRWLLPEWAWEKLVATVLGSAAKAAARRARAASAST